MKKKKRIALPIALLLLASNITKLNAVSIYNNTGDPNAEVKIVSKIMKLPAIPTDLPLIKEIKPLEDKPMEVIKSNNVGTWETKKPFTYDLTLLYKIIAKQLGYEYAVEWKFEHDGQKTCYRTEWFPVRLLKLSGKGRPKSLVLYSGTYDIHRSIFPGKGTTLRKNEYGVKACFIEPEKVGAVKKTVDTVVQKAKEAGGGAWEWVKKNLLPGGKEEEAEITK